VNRQTHAVWLGNRLAGDVEVLSRATTAPRLTGDQMLIARSGYAGHVEATGERFLNKDIHAGVREVAAEQRQRAPRPAQKSTAMPFSSQSP
jgi:hypothetical protein